MKINFKKQDVSFTMHIPIWLVNFIPSGLVNMAIKHNSNDGSNEIMKSIDFGDIKKSLDVLKEFKGLRILEIKNKSGEEITVNI